MARGGAVLDPTSRISAPAPPISPGRSHGPAILIHRETPADSRRPAPHTPEEGKGCEGSKESVQTITIPKATSLGLSLIGGNSRTEEALIHIKDIIPGGDCHKDGRLRPGDQLVSVNKESLIGARCDEAKSILNRAKLRKGACWEIAFIRPGDTPSGSSSLIQNDQKPRDIIPRMSSTPHTSGTCEPGQSGHIKDLRFSPLDQSLSDTSAPVPHQGPRREKLIPFTPDVRLKVEALEMALHFLGISPTEEQKRLLRSRVQMDANGTVSYGDFVRVSKEMFNLQLEDKDLGHLLKIHEGTRLLDLATNQVQSCDLSGKDDINKLKRERDEARAQLKTVKEQLLESEKQNGQLSVELTSVKQEAKAAVEETRALRSRIHLAEVAQRQARGVEMDYEEVIRLLEAEITELKGQLGEHSGQSKDNVQDLKRRITVLDCQLRKSEMARKTFEVSTEKLLQFVENVHEVLSDDQGSTLNLCERIPTFSTHLPRLGKSRSGITAAIATEAKELSRSIRSISDVDSLPYGWEEAYTADGIKYFINHVTETTSWTHPVTSALNLTYMDDSGEESLRDPTELKSC
ncbi:PREDICTED: syntaxin-binding protein 4 [Nanorana parkeri]|uniref:syntaxin-binding protein 4 n=1 Tax=Nanorana parkeri TaxID=125878 RepID=UPI0008549597|nr:PREDICTED: syntaxin-binding protein 4 [Nanorana parkeri]